MKIKKYKNTPDILTRKPTDNELTQAKLGKLRFVDSQGNKYSYLPEGYSVVDGSQKQVDNNKDLEGYMSLPEITIQGTPSISERDTDANIAHRQQVAAADNYVHNLGMTQLDKTQMNNLVNLGLTLGGTAAAVPFAWMAPVAFAGGMAGGIAGDYLGNLATQRFSNGKYNTWGDAMQDWTNGYIRADNAAITNPGALLGGTIGGVTVKPIFNFGKNMFNAGRNYFRNNSRLSFTNADQVVTPTTTSRLNLDDNLGEIMGRVRLGLKNTREYYNGEGFAQRMRNAGFTEDEIGQARTEIESILNNQSSKYTGIQVLEGTKPGLRGSSTFAHTPDTHYGATTKLYYNQSESGDQLYNILFHEYGGHGATANMNSNEFSTQYPMLARIMQHNNKLYMRYTEPTTTIRNLAKLSDDAIVKTLSPMNPTKTPKELINYVRHKAGRINYLSEPTEVRARAFEEIMTGRPNSSSRKGIWIFNEGDWNAYLQQFLKKGGKLFSRKNNVS